MRRRFSTWHPSQLFLIWGAYWIALLLWGLGPAIPIMMRVTKPDAHGSASISFGDGAFHFSIVENAATVWKLDITLGMVIALFTLPPLVLWILWLRTQRSVPIAAPSPLDAGEMTGSQIPAGPAGDRSAVQRQTRD